MAVQFSISDDWERFVENQVASGRFEEAGDVIQAALYLLQEQEREIEREWTVEELRREVQKGIDSGPDIPAEEVFARLNERYRRMAEAQSTE